MRVHFCANVHSCVGEKADQSNPHSYSFLKPGCCCRPHIIHANSIPHAFVPVVHTNFIWQVIFPACIKSYEHKPRSHTMLTSKNFHRNGYAQSRNICISYFLTEFYLVQWSPIDRQGTIHTIKYGHISFNEANAFRKLILL